MSEDHPLFGKPGSLSSEHPSQEAQLRQALDLMGGRRAGPAAGTPAHGNNGVRQAGFHPQPRHRYARDGEVPVVHATLGRVAGRPAEGASAQDKVIIETLRNNLEQERSAREVAERGMAETRQAMTALQTRLAHLEMDLRASQEQVSAQSESAQSEQATRIDAARSATAQVQEGSLVAAPAKRKSRTRTTSAPKPIKWWLRAGKA